MGISGIKKAEILGAPNTGESRNIGLFEGTGDRKRRWRRRGEFLKNPGGNLVRCGQNGVSLSGDVMDQGTRITQGQRAGRGFIRTGHGWGGGEALGPSQRVGWAGVGKGTHATTSSPKTDPRAELQRGGGAVGRGDPCESGHVIGSPRLRKISLPWRRGEGAQRVPGRPGSGPCGGEIPVPRPYERMHARQLPLVFVLVSGWLSGRGTPLSPPGDICAHQGPRGW